MHDERRDDAGRRRHDAQASREALLRAADALFEERGYDAATVRDIGEHAGVDAALIARYFGGKEGLYLATLQREGRAPMPADPMRVLERMLSRTERRGSNPVGLAMVSPTLTDACRDQVRAILARRVVAPLTAELRRTGRADARAARRDPRRARGRPHADARERDAAGARRGAARRRTRRARVRAPRAIDGARAEGGTRAAVTHATAAARSRPSSAR